MGRFKDEYPVPPGHQDLYIANQPPSSFWFVVRWFVPEGMELPTDDPIKPGARVVFAMSNDHTEEGRPDTLCVEYHPDTVRVVAPLQVITTITGALRQHLGATLSVVDDVAGDRGDEE